MHVTCTLMEDHSYYLQVPKEKWVSIERRERTPVNQLLKYTWLDWTVSFICEMEGAITTSEWPQEMASW